MWRNKNQKSSQHYQQALFLFLLYFLLYNELKKLLKIKSKWLKTFSRKSHA